MKQLNEQQILELIDGLCMCYWNGKEDLENAEKIIGDIYVVAHSHLERASCYDVHDNWRKKSVEWYKGLKEMGMC